MSLEENELLNEFNTNALRFIFPGAKTSLTNFLSSTLQKPFQLPVNLIKNLLKNLIIKLATYVPKGRHNGLYLYNTLKNIILFSYKSKQNNNKNKKS